MSENMLIKIIVSAFFVIVVYPSVRFIINKVIDKVAKPNMQNEGHGKMTKKTFNILILFLLASILISIWGVNTRNLLLAMSSIFAVIGVALFAQWSILSNITAGIVIFFSARFKIGDRIKIHDKDFPIEATLIDITTFYVYLETDEGEKIAYPNNLILQKGISVIKING